MLTNIKFFTAMPVPLEMHKVRIVQKLELKPLEHRIRQNQLAGNNAHLLKNEDVFIDMLTDSGVNAMSDRQLAAMMEADDAYAGSASFYKLEEKTREIFDMPYFLPAHQGRACEHLLSRVFVRPGMTVPMNYHFTTTKALIQKAGGAVLELFTPEAINAESECPFKGNLDLEKLRELIETIGASQIPFVRIEAGTNLIGGQPISLENVKAVSKICKKAKIKLVLDASLLADNVFFCMQREPACKKLSPREIILKFCDCFDILYFSGRKLTSARGGGMCFRKKEDYLAIRDLIPLYEGFSTYGGISVRELEAMAVGLSETLDPDNISQGPLFIAHMTDLLIQHGVPVVTPPGGLGIHLDAKRFTPHIPQNEYPAAAMACALYLISGIRGTERGSLSEERDENGNETPARMELLRLALPRRVFTLSQIHYAADRIAWLYRHGDLIGGLRFVDEPKTLRFFFGKLAPTSNWQEQLLGAFRAEVGNLL